MKKGIIGKKIGMTQIFDESGKVIPVTVVEAGPCMVIQKKTVENDGYDAIQVGFGDVKPQKLSKPAKGHFEKADVAPKKVLREFRMDDCSGYNVGDVIKADTFACGDMIDACGTSKGKGYAGAIKPMVTNLSVIRTVPALSPDSPALWALSPTLPESSRAKEWLAIWAQKELPYRISRSSKLTQRTI